MEEIKKSSWGGEREGAGRKQKNDYEARELFKHAFDELVTPSEWKKFVEISWKSGDWNKMKFLIEQRIGRPAKSESQDEPSEMVVRFVGSKALIDMI
jgi:hypothetical protein